MGVKEDIIANVKAIADVGRDTLKLSLGSEGNYVKLGGVNRETGAAWRPSPSVMETIIEGISTWLGGNVKPNNQWPVRVVVISGNVVTTDVIVELQQNALVLSLPLHGEIPTGTIFIIKAANVTGCSLNAQGGATIDGQATVALAPYQTVRVYRSGSEWRTW